MVTILCVPISVHQGFVFKYSSSGGPPPHRLGHDIMKVMEHWRGVFDNKGLNVGKNANGDRGNEGREAGKSGEKDSGHGGVRPDRVQEDKILDSWWHPDAQGAIESLLEHSEDRYNAGKSIRRLFVFVFVFFCCLIYDFVPWLILLLFCG